MSSIRIKCLNIPIFQRPKIFKSSNLVIRKFASTTVPVVTASSPVKLIDECLRIRESIQPFNDRIKGPLEKSSQKNTILPFVFLLGNHSSGKSSFVNYICQRKIQTAGVAPTDDTFTIIAPGPTDGDRDGPAFLGDPDMGYSGLKTFGPQLIHHTQLKVRSNLAIKNFMLVDSPGMIDSPMMRDNMGAIRTSVMDRGYDFEGVCRWYAERADVILLFFDPDKPGTTGETLSILTNALMGLDHKLHIILNKADQFKKIHDFARAYGSLCWNLSKVIQRKDLPRIYTMCLPTSFQARASGDQSDEQSLGQGLIDLEATREEVVAEVLNAPNRRVDNEISRLADCVSLLLMHSKVVDDLRKKYRKAIIKSRLTVAASALLSSGIIGGTLMMALPINIMAGSALAGTVFTAGLYWWQTKSLDDFARELVSDEVVEATFRKIYARRIAEKDEFTMAMWKRVHEHLKLGLSGSELQELNLISSSEFDNLNDIIENEIPKLRRLAAPSFHK